MQNSISVREYKSLVKYTTVSLKVLYIAFFLHREKKDIFFRIRIKECNAGLIIWESKQDVELHRPILDVGDRAKMLALFQLTATFNAT